MNEKTKKVRRIIGKIVGYSLFIIIVAAITISVFVEAGAMTVAVFFILVAAIIHQEARYTRLQNQLPNLKKLQEGLDSFASTYDTKPNPKSVIQNVGEWKEMKDKIRFSSNPITLGEMVMLSFASTGDHRALKTFLENRSLDKDLDFKTLPAELAGEVLGKALASASADMSKNTVQDEIWPDTLSDTEK